MSRAPLYILVLVLTTLGLGLFLYKILVLGFPLVPKTMAVAWNVEGRITFSAQGKPVKVSLYIPSSTARFKVMNENFISRGYGLNTITESEHDNRLATWSINKAKGKQILFYRGVMRRTELEKKKPSQSPPPIEPPGFKGPYLEAAEALIAMVRAQSADVDGLVVGLLKHLNTPHPDENVSLLLQNQTSIATKVDITTKVLSQAGIPARLVRGIQLQEQDRNAPVAQWFEVYDKGLWRPYDPAAGKAGIPDNYMAWWRGTKPLGRVVGGEGLEIRISVNLDQEAAIKRAIDYGKTVTPFLIDYSLFSLPIQAQAVFGVLLLVPIGALLVVILRNVIGVKTFGTFMPILIALAFRQTNLLWGIVLFTILVALGLGVRHYLEHLKLLLVPRLASLLIIVILLMAVMSVLTHKLGLEQGLSVALFPMVIMTMTIERMTIVWEERGAKEALQQGTGSLLVAALACTIMQIRYLGHLIFTFPELLLVLLAGTLLLGRYTGYRLLELPRFRALIREKK